jgi:hypothetical protein
VKRDIVLSTPPFDPPTLSRLSGELARFPGYDRAIIIEDAQSRSHRQVALL